MSLALPEYPLEPGIIGVWQAHQDTTGSLTLAIPSTAGIAAGDILIAVGAYNNVTTPTNLTGWSAWDAQQTISATTAALATRTADGTENGTNIVFTSPTEGRKVLMIMAIRGYPGGGTLTADLHPAAAVNTTGGTTSTVASPTGTTGFTNEVVLNIFVAKGTGTHVFSQIDGYTITQESGTLAASVNHGVAIARTAEGATGSVGGLTLTDAITTAGSVGWMLSYYTLSANQSKSASDTGAGSDVSTLAGKYTGADARTDSGTGADASTEAAKFTGANARTDSAAGYEQGALAFGLLIASGQNSGAGTSITTAALSTTPAVGELVVAWFSCQSAAKTFTISDNSVGGNTWNTLQMDAASVGQSGVLAWTIVTNTFTTITATISSGSVGGRLYGAMKYPAGVYASVPGDVAVAASDATGTDTGNTVSSGTFATVPEQAIAFASLTSQRADPTTDYIYFDSAWIPRDIRNHSATTVAWHAVAEQTVLATTSVTETVRFIGSGTSNVGILSLKFAPTTTSKNASDSAAGSDTSTLKVSLPRTDSGSGTEVSQHYYKASESGTGADTSIEKIALPRTDSGTGADSTRSLRNRTDSGTGADASTEKVALPRVDSAAGAEVSRNLRNRTDAATAADASIERISLPRIESGTGTEISRSYRSRTESGSGTEVSALHVVLLRSDAGVAADVSFSYRNRTDSATGSDASAEHAVYARTESGTCVDSSRNLRNRTDAATGTEASALKVVLARTEQGVGAELSTEAEHVVALDTATTNDVSSLKASLPRTDAGTSSDVSTLHVSLPRTDAATGADASQHYYRASDSGTATNGSFLHARYSLVESPIGVDASASYRNRTDSAAAADASSEHANYSRTDTSSASDASQSYHAGTESASGADTSAEHAILARSESASGAEAIHHYYAASDNATGADSSHLSVPKSGTDSATSTDVSTLRAVSNVLETGVGSETSTEHAAFQVLESGTANDVSHVSTFTQVRVNDSATGTDASSERAALSPTDAVVTNDSSLIHAVSLRGENGSTSENSSLHAAPVGTDTGSSSEATQSSRKGTEAAAGTDLSILHTILAAADSGAVADLGILHALLARVESAASTDTSHITFGKVPVFGTEIGSGSDSSLIPFVRHARSDTAAAFEAHLIHALLTRIDSARGFDRSTGGEPPPVTFSKMVIDLRTGNPLVWIAGKSTETSTYLDTKSGRLITPDKHSLMDFIDA